MMHRLLVHARGNVVAYLALFVALGGTSYAAAKLPANSVGSRQLSRGAVSSIKVKDGSLAARDFRPGQLHAGPQGATGARGPVGVRGPSGSQGETGPSDTWAHAMTSATSFTLGPGKYEYHLAAYFINNGGSPVAAGCYEGMSAGGAPPVRFEGNYAKTTVPASGGYGSVAKEGVVEITDSKQLDFGCDESVNLTVDAYVTVTKVGTLH
jgi:hypothetical protein